MKLNKQKFRSKNLEFRNKKIIIYLPLYSFLNSKFKILNSSSGFTMVVLMVAFLVLFTTISLIKVGSLSSIHPDLTRVGINLNNKSSQNIAHNPTDAKEPVVTTPTTNSTN